MVCITRRLLFFSVFVRRSLHRLKLDKDWKLLVHVLSREEKTCIQVSKFNSLPSSRRLGDFINFLCSYDHPGGNQGGILMSPEQKTSFLGSTQRQHA